MKGEVRFSIFYAYLGFFTFAMLGLVMAPNIITTLYLLGIGRGGVFPAHWFFFYKLEAKAAAKKAFIMTRIGDVGYRSASFFYSGKQAALNMGILSSRSVGHDIK